MLQPNDTIMALVDVQGKLAQRMFDREAVFANIERLVRAMQALHVPILWVEQTPEKLGPTIPRLAALLAPLAPISKSTFSCRGEPVFLRALEASGRKNVVLTGIETHVCIYQTAADLAADGYHVEVVADAVSSRSPANRRIGLERIVACAGFKTSTEMLIFELTRNTAHPAFRDILTIVR